MSGETQEKVKKIKSGMAELSRNIDRLRRELREELEKTREEIISSLDELGYKVMLTPLIQLCRDNMRNILALNALSDTMVKYSHKAHEDLDKISKSFLIELEEIDKELDKSLRRVLEDAIEFRDRVNEIKGRATEEPSGFMRVTWLIKKMIEKFTIAVKTRKESLESIRNDIVGLINEIRGERDNIVNQLNVYSAKNVFGSTVVMGIPIVKIYLVTNKRKGGLYLTFEPFKRYIPKILKQADAHEFRVNYDLFLRVTDLIKRSRGLLFRHFLNNLVKIDRGA